MPCRLDNDNVILTCRKNAVNVNYNQLKLLYL